MIKELISIWISKEKRNYILTDSKGATATITSPESLLEFLTIDYGDDSARVVWNLYELFGILQQQLPIKIINEIAKNDRAWYKNFKIFSSSGKVISIGNHVNEHANFYHRIETNTYSLRQYFPNDKVANLSELDAKANELLKTLGELGWQTDSLSSAIAIYDNVLNKIFIPTVYDLPDEIDDMVETAYTAMNREWRTTFQLGHFPEAYDYDVCGAYPSVIRNFGDISNCTFWKSDKFQKADWGIALGEVTINSDYSPIVNSVGICPKGSWEDVLTMEQIAFLYHYRIGTFKIKQAYYLNYNHPDDKPLKEVMETLYRMRDRGGLCKTLVKNVSVGIYGRFAEEYPEKFGRLFNPLYALMTTTRMSITVGKFIFDNNLFNDLISVTVDGLLSSKEIQCSNTKIFGTWRSDKVSALVLSIGHQYVTNYSNKDTMDANFNTYSKMIEEIKDHPNKNFINDVLLNKNMLITNRDFTTFPKKFGDIMNTTYKSSAIKV
jgi:hypothetical protein